jgi:hypothetical protein
MPLNLHLQRVIDKIGIGRLAAPYISYEQWRWRRRGSPVPPPASMKRELIRRVAMAYGIGVLVETGTFLGDTVQAALATFRQVYSIELSQSLHARAVRRFRGVDRVVLLHGDSAARLPEVVARLREPALFWLDGHYSAGFTAKAEKDTPILEELKVTLESSIPHVVLVDDARLFNGTSDYPRIEDVQAIVRRLKGAAYSVAAADDIIRVLPPL